MVATPTSCDCRKWAGLTLTPPIKSKSSQSSPRRDKEGEMARNLGTGRNQGTWSSFLSYYLILQFVFTEFDMVDHNMSTQLRLKMKDSTQM